MKNFLVTLPVVPFLTPATISFFVSTSSPSLDAQRLPANVLPEHYSLTLTPDLKAATFSGDETIGVNIKAPTRTITLNAAEIDFQSVNAITAGKQIPAA